MVMEITQLGVCEMKVRDEVDQQVTSHKVGPSSCSITAQQQGEPITFQGRPAKR